MNRAHSLWIGIATLVSAWQLAPAQSFAQPFNRPSECESCISGHFYVDHPGDWNCGASTYPGHRGTDYSLLGGNGAIGAGQNRVLALVGGMATTATDGYLDMCSNCSTGGGDGCGIGSPQSLIHI